MRSISFHRQLTVQFLNILILFEIGNPFLFLGFPPQAGLFPVPKRKDCFSGVLCFQVIPFAKSDIILTGNDAIHVVLVEFHAVELVFFTSSLGFEPFIHLFNLTAGMGQLCNGGKYLFHIKDRTDMLPHSRKNCLLQQNITDAVALQPLFSLLPERYIVIIGLICGGLFLSLMLRQQSAQSLNGKTVSLTGCRPGVCAGIFATFSRYHG